MRLIDADALTPTTVIRLDRAGEKKEKIVYAEQIENAPTIDAVVIVRCKDCKHFRRFVEKEYEWLSDGYCFFKNSSMHDEDFCFNGERRGE